MLDLLPAPSATLPRKGAAARRPRSSSAWVGYLFIAPNLLGFVAFTLLPMLFALVIAFTRWDVVSGLGGIQWIGGQNFIDLWHDPEFWQSTKLTLIYAGVGVPLAVGLGLVLALGLNGPLLGRTFLRVIFFLPFIVNPVAIASTWVLLYDPTFGPIDQALMHLGIAHPPLWLVSTNWAIWGLIILAVWTNAGYAATIYLAALQDISPNLYEAARIDGAGAWTRLRAITWPALGPTTFFLLVTVFISTSQAFGLINLMTQGGPGNATTTLSYYIYLNGFQFYRFGYAAALAWIMFIGVFALTALLWWLQRRGGTEGVS